MMTSKLINLFFAFFILSSSMCWAQQNSFNPSGYFVPSQPQRNASKVRWILLSDYSQSGKPNPIFVELRIGTETQWKTFLQSSLTIKDYKISFKTKPQNGLVYEFQGEFRPNGEERKSGSFKELSNTSTALSGVLKTKRGKKTLMSEKLLFYYTMGD